MVFCNTIEGQQELFNFLKTPKVGLDVSIQNNLLAYASEFNYPSSEKLQLQRETDVQRERERVVREFNQKPGRVMIATDLGGSIQLTCTFCINFGLIKCIYNVDCFGSGNIIHVPAITTLIRVLCSNIWVWTR